MAIAYDCVHIFIYSTLHCDDETTKEINARSDHGFIDFQEIINRIIEIHPIRDVSAMNTN